MPSIKGPITLKSRKQFPEEIKNLIYKMQLRIEDLEKSRGNWKEKYIKLKNG